MKCFLTHDNYKRPFFVKYFPQKHFVEIFASSNYRLKKIQYDKLLVTYANIQKIFIGKDRDPMNTHLPPTFGDGNSILIKLPENVYVFVGTEIYSFRTPSNDIITSFYSNIGNNDSPDPIAVGKEYIYFLFFKTYVNKKNVKNWKDAYNMDYEKRDKLGRKIKIRKMFMKHLEIYGYRKIQSSSGVSFIPFESLHDQ